MRVVVADPPAFTPPYDHALAVALARAGAEVELVTSRFRFGAVAEPEGYRRRELFYPLSSRLFGRSRLRLPLKVLEHPLGLARLAATPADVVHVQWLALPEVDSWLLRHRAPLVLTAHDLLPRRTAAKTGLWRRAFGRFERIVVHSERGRETLAAFGVPEAEAARDPPPRHSERSGPAQTTAGRCSRSASCGPTSSSSTRARPPRAQAPNSALPATRMRSSPRRRSTAPSASRPSRSSPTAPSSTRAARSCGRSAPGCPRSSTTSAASASRCASFGAGRVVAPDDVDGLAAAIRELIDDEAALAAARAGALRAREKLTWDAAAQAHLDLYRELT